MLERTQKTITKLRPTLPCILPLILIAMLVFSISCAGQAVTTSAEPTTSNYTDVTPEEAYDMISQHEVVLLDVRTQEEYDSGHIPGALLIPLSELESRLDKLNPSDHILVYCRSGHRSAEAASILIANGFTRVYNMAGGILQWQAEGLPVYIEQTPATSPEPTMPSYTDVTPEEAHEMISQQEVVVIDLRAQEEYDSGHIPGALLIPLSELESRLDELNTSGNILAYHSCGGCSKKAVQILVDNGFFYVYNLKGGISQWQAQGFPVTQEEKCPSCG